MLNPEEITFFNNIKMSSYPSLTGPSCLSTEWVLSLLWFALKYPSDHVWAVSGAGTLLADCLCTSLETHPQDSVLDWWVLLVNRSLSSYSLPLLTGGVIFLGVVENAMFLAEFQNINNSGQVKGFLGKTRNMAEAWTDVYTGHRRVDSCGRGRLQWKENAGKNVSLVSRNMELYIFNHFCVCVCAFHFLWQAGHHCQLGLWNCEA